MYLIYLRYENYMQIYFNTYGTSNSKSPESMESVDAHKSFETKIHKKYFV